MMFSRITVPRSSFKNLRSRGERTKLLNSFVQKKLPRVNSCTVAQASISSFSDLDMSFSSQYSSLRFWAKPKRLIVNCSMRLVSFSSRRCSRIRLNNRAKYCGCVCRVKNSSWYCSSFLREVLLSAFRSNGSLDEISLLLRSVPT